MVVFMYVLQIKYRLESAIRNCNQFQVMMSKKLLIGRIPLLNRWKFHSSRTECFCRLSSHNGIWLQDCHQVANLDIRRAHQNCHVRKGTYEFTVMK
ncbi:hypothetical protein TanjilG_27750 [Lupinus angustifolius]|uniref:Uncharacterized protein n=1 Tax=Lupinus angustifolius TaxID=3871 RepID=A0A4P1RHL2_LUPAN|nr:hypothetical protein TanjilG_27750 [Lupinus angustifolius]